MAVQIHNLDPEKLSRRDAKMKLTDDGRPATRAELGDARRELSRNERIKLEKSGFDVWDDIVQRYQHGGFESIDEEDFERFKWYGIYQQRPKNGHFMMRLKIPGGALNRAQWRQVAHTARQYARGVADISTRMSFQMHWLRIEDIPGIVERYKEVGLITRGACGDVCRNVVSSPLAGIDPDEALDPTELVNEASNFFAYNPEFNDMPRKFKVCIGGNLAGIQSEVHEVVLYGVRRSDGSVGYGLRVGGGLSTEPYIAQDVRVFVTPEEAMKVLEATAVIYRDHGYRKSRKHARYKYLVADWGAEHYREVLEDILGYALPDAEPLPEDYPGYEDRYGVHPQKQEGLSYVGVPVIAGRLNADQLDAIGDIAEEFGTGDVRLTVMQSFYIINVPNEKTGEVVKRLEAAGLPVERSAIARGVVACTGIQFCNLAVTETKERAQTIARELDKNVQWKSSEFFRINVNGCPNSCGQHWVADVGLQGCTKKVDGELKEHFDMFLGGGLGHDAAYNRRILRMPAEEVPAAIQRVMEAFEAQKQEGESFKQFCARHDDDTLAAMLSG